MSYTSKRGRTCNTTSVFACILQIEHAWSFHVALMKHHRFNITDFLCLCMLIRIIHWTIEKGSKLGSPIWLSTVVHAFFTFWTHSRACLISRISTKYFGRIFNCKSVHRYYITNLRILFVFIVERLARKEIIYLTFRFWQWWYSALSTFSSMF
jgi:hypothetical protein